MPESNRTGRVLAIVLLLATLAAGGLWLSRAVAPLISPALADHPYSEPVSRNGNGYSERIAELRIYKTNDRGAFWYALPDLERKRLVFESRDKRVIARVLKAADMGPELGERGYCDRILSDYRLHVVTLEQDGELFGYFIVAPMEAVKTAPAGFDTCADVTFSDENLWGWASYEFFDVLEGLGVTIRQ